MEEGKKKKSGTYKKKKKNRDKEKKKKCIVWHAVDDIWLKYFFFLSFSL